MAPLPTVELLFRTCYTNFSGTMFLDFQENGLPYLLTFHLAIFFWGTSNHELGYQIYLRRIWETSAKESLPKPIHCRGTWYVRRAGLGIESRARLCIEQNGTHIEGRWNIYLPFNSIARWVTIVNTLRKLSKMAVEIKRQYFVLCHWKFFELTEKLANITKYLSNISHWDNLKQKLLYFHFCQSDIFWDL